MLVVVAVMVALVVTLTGDDSDDSARDPGQDSSQTPTDPDSAPDGASDNASDGASPSPAPESSAPSDGPTSTSADGRMTGTLYSYQIPSGWNDITKDMADQPTVDTVSGDGEGLYSSQESLIVELGSTFGKPNAQALKDTWKKTLTGGNSTVKVVDTKDATIDGKPAVTVRLEHEKVGDMQTVQYGWLLIVDGKAVSIVLTTTDPDKSQSMQTGQDILKSWTWN
ncbi:hypothetical protein BJ980_001267 [Nocardioides daedukensis]|uniref:DUF1795 domain-containing protein n=1 Tax=Nocardioides daedukensis TaxID=634462 RepID=A0A7Y9S249_9ACTN|nr:hypothetical protein [Nocardioides daedukensis]NYG58344.1 hypothetical protein [Nocardioides daedukensis]